MTITPFTAGSLHIASDHVVQVWKQNVINPKASRWELDRHLRCRQLRLPVLPGAGISQAILEYEYGTISRFGGDFTLELRRALIGSFVRILLNSGDPDEFKQREDNEGGLFAITTEKAWVGFVITQQDFDSTDAFAGAAAGTEERGDQEIIAVGPEWLLSRKQLHTSRIRDNATGDTYEIQRALPFNLHTGNVRADSPQDQPNLSTSSKNVTPQSPSGFTAGIEVLSFAQQLSTDAEPWRADQIIRYLFDFHAPVRVTYQGSPIHRYPNMNWHVINSQMFAPYVMQINAHGRTIMSLLEEIANPRRFANFTIEYFVTGIADENFGEWDVRFNSVTSSAINPPGGGTPIPANPRTIQFDISGTLDATKTRTEDAAQEFDQVYVTGARRGVVATFKLLGPYLKEGWTSQEETIYDLDLAQLPQGDLRDFFNDNAIPHEDKLQRAKELRKDVVGNVYSRWIMPDDTDLIQLIQPDLSDAETILFETEMGKQYLPGLRFQKKLPMNQRWDYSVDPPVPLRGAPRHPEKMDIFTIFKTRDIGGEETFVKGQNLGLVMKSESNVGDVDSVAITPLEDAPGLWIRPLAHEPHWMARQKSGIAFSDTVAAFDYTTEIEVTVYFHLDDFAFGGYPASIYDLGRERNANTHYIRLGNVAFHDVALPGTVLDIREGKKITFQVQDPNPPGLFEDKKLIIRDDRDILNDIARLAYEWYGKRRDAYSLSFRQIILDADPGMIVTDIDLQSTDLVITEVVWDLREGMTSVATGYGDPDFSALIERIPG